MRGISFALALASLLATGCSTNSQMPPMTQLQAREFQTRDFPADDMKLVMKAVLNVLQDEGFMVREANSDLGVIAASREVDIENKTHAMWTRVFFGDNARWDKNSIIEVTANVSSHGDKMRVRANFQLKTLNNMGQVSQVRAVGDEPYYQEFFAKVDKAIFIEKEKL